MAAPGVKGLKGWRCGAGARISPTPWRFTVEESELMWGGLAIVLGKRAGK